MRPRATLRSDRDSLHNLELISARVANIEAPGTRHGPRIWNNFNASIAKPSFSYGEIVNGQTDVARAQRTRRFVLHGQMYLRRSELIPGAALTRCRWFRNLLQAHDPGIEFLCRRLQLRRHRDVNVMK